MTEWERQMSLRGLPPSDCRFGLHDAPRHGYTGRIALCGVIVLIVALGVAMAL